jgi:DNA-binding NtrC family response regulator
VIEPEAVRLLQQHDWPGNVRELANVLERGAAMAPSDSIGAELIRLALPARGGHAPRRIGDPADLASRLAEAERRAILDALDASGGQKLAAAKRLGISRSQFYEKLRRYEINA